MYDRAPRVLTSCTTGTTVEVGPGKYDPTTSSIPNRKHDGYAPFLSMSTRDSFLTVKVDVSAAPGPGSYDPKLFETINGGSALANQGIRFHEKPQDTPGPGCYNLSKTSDWLKEKHNNQESTNSKNVANNFLQRVTYHRKSAPPSIPSPGQAYGYEEGKDGDLQKQKVPAKDASLGPAFYKINYDETMAVKKYKGIHFGKMTSRRNSSHKAEDLPGPGTYDPHKPKPKAPIDLIIEEQQKQPFVSKLPRYHEMISMQESKKAVPGPGHYQIKSQFENGRVNGAAKPRPSFGAQEKRFSELNESTPSPGLYNDPRHALEICNRISGMKKSPFGQTAIRFDREHHVRRTPGPGSYDHADLATELKKKAIGCVTRKGGFGSTSSRMVPLNRQNEEHLPGPGQYSMKSTLHDMPSNRKHAVFESGTSRCREPRAGNDAPPPGSYEVAKSYDITQGKSLYRGPNSSKVTEKTRRINGGFLSSTKRFSQPRDVILKKADSTIPGPGQYDVKKPDIPGGSLVTKEERFKQLFSDVPGPGTYQLSPLLQHSVLKSTFNSTLNNPVAHALEELNERKIINSLVPLAVNF